MRTCIFMCRQPTAALVHLLGRGGHAACYMLDVSMSAGMHMSFWARQRWQCWRMPDREITGNMGNGQVGMWARAMMMVAVAAAFVQTAPLLSGSAPIRTVHKYEHM